MNSDERLYEVRLSQFEGPLDLLLHLVRKAEIELKDIFVAQITEQYMQYMEHVNDVNLDRACEFLKTASLLLLIKSRSLLPKQVPDSAEDEDPAQTLIERLREYEIYKSASDELRKRECCGARMFCRAPLEYRSGSAGNQDLHGNGQMLLDAFARILERRRNKASRNVRIESEAWSVAHQKEKIMKTLSNVSIPVAFTSFFDANAGLQEVSVTFSAMLELWTMNEIRVEQPAAFAEILVSLAENRKPQCEAG